MERILKLRDSKWTFIAILLIINVLIIFYH